MANGWLKRKIHRKDVPGILLVFVLIGNLVALMSQNDWLFALADHFRWHYLICSMLGLIGAVFWRQRSIAILFIFFTSYQIWIISPWDWGSNSSQVRSLTNDFPKNSLIWFNVSTSNKSKQKVVQYLMARDPDLILLAEVDQSWIEALSPLNADWPAQMLYPREDNFGMAVYGKEPLVKNRQLKMDAFEVPCLQFMFPCPEGKEIAVYVVHPVPPIGKRYTTSRDAYLSALSESMNSMKQPCLVIGDFNATPWHYPVKRLLQEHLLDCHLPSPIWFHTTWPSGLLPLGIPIDLCLTDPKIHVHQTTRGPALGSDHRPIEILFSAP